MSSSRLQAFALFFLLGAAPLHAAWSPKDLPDAVLVTWRHGLDRTALAAEAQRLGLDSSAGELKLRQALHASVGARLTRSVPAIALDQVRLPAGGGAAVDAAIALYQASPLVESAEPDPMTRLAAACPPMNDPLYNGGQQWYLTATAWPQAVAAWCAGSITLSAQVVVAVLDTGADAHPDLAPQLLSGSSFVTGEPSTDDLNGHGTFVAGLIGASAGNGSAMAGAFFDPAHVRVLPVKVLDQCGTGSLGDMAAGIAWAVAQGARVINLSVESDGGATALRNAISLARAQNVMLVAAAGNSNAYTAYPAIYSNVFAVGALDHLGGKASYSNYGKLELSAPGGDLDQYCACLAAPAGCNWEVWSLSGTYPACSQPNSVTYTCALANGVEGGAGTSFSAPLVAAAAALLFSQDPALHVEEVSQRLMQSALPTSAGPGWHSSTGWGKLNFYGALTQPLAAGPATVLKVWNSPNPFSPGRDAYTTLTFVLPAPAPVSLKLYDGGGELVKAWELGAGGTFAGMNMLNWDGRSGTGMAVANGAYLLVLESGGARAINRVAVLR